MPAFTTEITAARAALTAAQGDLATAIRHSTPFEPELMDKLQAFDPAAFSDCLARMDTIRETIPVLEGAVGVLQLMYDELAEQACHRCSGTGVYSAPTGYTRKGVPYCFACGGDGRDAKTRKAAAKAAQIA